MIKRSGIRIDPEKFEEFKKAAIENAKKHDAEYWRKSYELTSRKLDFDRIKRLCGYDESCDGSDRTVK